MSFLKKSYILIFLNEGEGIKIRDIYIYIYDFDLIRRDLVLETFRNKFSYLCQLIITSIYKFL